MIVNIDLHLRITHESTGAYFQWGPMGSFTFIYLIMTMQASVNGLITGPFSERES